METVESERKMHCPVILVSVKDPFLYIYKYIYFIHTYIYIIYISLLYMYRCVSLISTKHFAKYTQEHLCPPLEARKRPGCTTSPAEPSGAPRHSRALRPQPNPAAGRMHSGFQASGEECCWKCPAGAKPRARAWPHRCSGGLAERQAQSTATLPEASPCSAC